MKKTKIDWADATINCVYGCPNGCKYCYGNVMNKRFHFCKDWKVPEWKPEHLKEFESGKRQYEKYGKLGKSIFIDSMSDIGTWKQEWRDKVFNAMYENPQHTYIALTKCEKVDIPYWLRQDKMRGRFFLGQTQTSGIVFNGFNERYRDFLSIEPLLGEIHFNGFGGIRTVIIGAETGNRKNKVVPQKEWVDNIVKECDEQGVKVFMKKSLRKIMGDDFRQDKLPWEIER